MIRSLDTALLEEFPLHAFAVHFTLHTSVRLTHFIPPSFASRYSVFESRASVVVCLGFFILSSARLYLLKELPFPLFASCLSFHSYSSSLQARMLGYYVFLFWSFARVSLFFVLCSAMIYSSCFLACAFTSMERGVPVNDFMSWPHLCYFALCIIHLRACAALVCVPRL